MSQTPYPTRIDMEPATRTELIDILQQALANAVDLQTQVKQAHWNVKGLHFLTRHELFDRLAESLRGHSDALAERASTLGGIPRGTARMAAERSELSEYPATGMDAREHVSALADRYGTWSAFLRKATRKAGRLDDPATEDLFTEVLRAAELDLWFLESHLQD